MVLLTKARPLDRRTSTRKPISPPAYMGLRLLNGVLPNPSSLLQAQLHQHWEASGLVLWHKSAILGFLHSNFHSSFHSRSMSMNRVAKAFVHLHTMLPTGQSARGRSR